MSENSKYNPMKHKVKELNRVSLMKGNKSLLHDRQLNRDYDTNGSDNRCFKVLFLSLMVLLLPVLAIFLLIKILFFRNQKKS